MLLTPLTSLGVPDNAMGFSKSELLLPRCNSTSSFDTGCLGMIQRICHCQPLLTLQTSDYQVSRFAFNLISASWLSSSGSDENLLGASWSSKWKTLKVDGFRDQGGFYWKLKALQETWDDTIPQIDSWPFPACTRQPSCLGQWKGATVAVATAEVSISARVGVIKRRYIALCALKQLVFAYHVEKNEFLNLQCHSQIPKRMQHF